MTAEEIAAGLTPAQSYLLKLAATNHHVVTLEKGIYAGMTKLLVPYDNRRPGTQAFTITPLGMQVRAILESNHDRA